MTKGFALHEAFRYIFFRVAPSQTVESVQTPLMSIYATPLTKPHIHTDHRHSSCLLISVFLNKSLCSFTLYAIYHNSVNRQKFNIAKNCITKIPSMYYLQKKRCHNSDISFPFINLEDLVFGFIPCSAYITTNIAYGPIMIYNTSRNTIFAFNCVRGYINFSVYSIYVGFLKIISSFSSSCFSINRVVVFAVPLV